MTTPNDSSNPRATARLITPPGQAGIAVVQLAGRDALQIIQDLFKGKQSLAPDPLNADKLYFGRFVDNQDVIDDVIVAHRPIHPNDGCVEINSHGGLRVTERILAALATRGAHVIRDDRSVDLAWAGPSRFENEILERAAKMPTRRLAKWVLSQRTAMPELVSRWTDLIERGQIKPVAAELDRLIARRHQTKMLLRGIKVALIGPPNAGKSTLINALSGLEGSIVSDRPGTTRDWVEHHAAIDGIPINYIDTAGIGAPRDDIDQQAMTRAHHQAADADLRLLLLDHSAPLPNDLDTILNAMVPPSITVLNKVDRPAQWTPEELNHLPCPAGQAPFRISALKKTGLVPLTHAIQGALGYADFHDADPVLLTDDQYKSAQTARNALPKNPDIAAQHVRELIS